ncbi:sigma-70 family RNA polymerase sigma factor [Kribbella sandramycini]|uniref:RNA polymerase sigma-70 factor (ECF subfamily) n=1 Tax=Kribbella sandramycini TaxID=60450 RepID=A0A7Y4NZV9_9ACTN|nr:sigma-70 family RNA polymerase sigma factor [Kribbella sandramycini]MBB6565041.1 RNA polymerase sigma-70 factor (ECF subfamily) [Kribbella sandramycini]NOL41313.1 sigma-70 family RNA polymerase sigma factor [Kribbella sandramycini]
MSDQELWRRAVDGETEAFGSLFDRHATAVYNFLFRRTASWSDAEDLTSLVFLHGWRRRAEVELVHDSALPWLLRTADYVLRNEFRRQRFRRLNLLRQTAVDEPDHAEGVAARIDDEREAQRLRALLRKLPKHEQEIVELCFWSGLDAQSAAVALDVPLGTVKSRLSRARKRLRDLSVVSTESLENLS